MKVQGWFSIPGKQAGKRTVESQSLGLEQIEFSGKTVLDLGCAEGAISHRALRDGARLAHGVELMPIRVRKARRLCQYQNAIFWVSNLEQFEKIHKADTKFLQHYDIALVLSVLHKLATPLRVLDYVASISDLLAIRLVARVLADARSAPLVVDIPCHLAGRFDLIAEPATSIEPNSGKAEWLGIFKRKRT